MTPFDASGGGSSSGSNGSGTGDSSGSTSSAPKLNGPPSLEASGGGSGAGLINPAVPGDYQMSPGPIPVGMDMLISAIDPAGGQNFTSVAWSGGTDYDSYFSNEPGTTPPTSMKPLKGLFDSGPATNNPDYSFIVDAQPKS